MIRPILQHPDPLLRRICDRVPEISDEIKALASDMLETMYDAPGRGLAAPQVGELIRLFVIDTTWKEGAATPIVFVNPQIIATAPEQQTNAEACLSISDQSLDIARPSWVDVVWTDLNGTEKHDRFDGFAAACICHENDHLNGKLILDYEVAA
ncbi:MAG: peptide deformylase [Litoreibacter sp.]|nr:peptide deformylase [Litoreibacter sp.]